MLFSLNARIRNFYSAQKFLRMLLFLIHTNHKFSLKICILLFFLNAFQSLWLPQFDSNERNVGVRVRCLTAWLWGNSIFILPKQLIRCKCFKTFFRQIFLFYNIFSFLEIIYFLFNSSFSIRSRSC